MNGKTKILILSLTFIFLDTMCFAQDVGDWTNYQSYSSATKVIDTGNLVYCAGNGSLSTYNKDDNSVEKLSSINGLSDVGIETIAYGSESDVVLIDYENSNIDLISDNLIYNISDIKRKQILGDKSINNIMFDGDLAYLACGFGIVVINTEKKEIKDTWYIAENGGHINVNDITTDGTYFYAATDEGIYYASVSEANLQDYSNWHIIEDIPSPEGVYTHIKNFNGKIVASLSPDSGNDQIYMLENGTWAQVYSQISTVYDMTVSSDNHILISNESDIYVFDEDGTVSEKIYQYLFTDNQVTWINPRSAVLDDDGDYWIADNLYGLVHKSSSSYEQLSPDGPVDDKVFSLYQSGDDLWMASGGRTAAWGNLWNQARFQKYADDKWTAYDEDTYSEMADFRDVVCIVTNPNDSKHVFVGCWGAGVLEFQDDEFVEQYSYNNSSLQTVIAGEDYVRVGGMAFDSDGTLWVNNGGASEPLSSFKDGKWNSYALSELDGTPNFGNIVITDDGDKWIAMSNRDGDIYVVKGANEDQRLQYNIAYFTNGTDETYLPMHEVYCMVIDRDGAIWVGAEGGIAVYSDPSSIWEKTEDDPLYAEQPGLDMDDGIYHPLLSSETVTAIAVDGDNRKWCGTESDGVYLISEDGEEELEHFTTDNSPLLSDEITSIAINNNSGEIFFGTSEGLISYKGVATEPSDAFDDVYVYPNPVRETYDGPVIITGLVENTDVKITDISGNLVYHGTSVGGQASWDGKTPNGHRCHTGVYLVFLNDETGEETFVTKLLFIH